LYTYIQSYYLSASRELKRLDSISRSPIYAQFGETLNGVSTIRAYAAEDRFVNNNNRKLDLNQAAYFATLAANRWLAVRLEAVGNSVVFFSGFFAVISEGSVNPGNAGLSLTYALSMTSLLNMLVRMYTEVETQMVSVERMEQYTTIPPEAPEVTAHRPASNWPSEGNVKFENIQLRYREGLFCSLTLSLSKLNPNFYTFPGLELVLRGITADIRPREKIGVVGRTGAGKSSLMLALFRMVELSEGRIFIDGIDISKIGLNDLRSKMSIIPQDPTLFTGTIRSNLDPFGVFSDQDIWKALDSVR
jgi:ATP-binding cassette subfamily C (CFTR/MRP) protein 1